jgi:hypothetical protein
VSAPLGPLTSAALTAVTALVLAAIVCWHAHDHRRRERAHADAKLTALLDQAAIDRAFDGITADFEEPTP